MIGLATQLGGNGSEAGSSSALGPFLVIVGAAVAVGLALALSEALRPRIHAVLRRRRSRRARVAASVDVERRARAMMSELCPYGWRAQITLHDVRSDEAARDAVALDWYELRPGGGEPAVMRRVWAASVGEAMEAMVADRRTDETLEQIELRATAGGAQWPDL